MKTTFQTWPDGDTSFIYKITYDSETDKYSYIGKDGYVVVYKDLQDFKLYLKSLRMAGWIVKIIPAFKGNV